MKLLELLQKCDYITDAGSLDVEIKDVIYDSRKVVPGCVFVALKGYNVDGHKFIPDAVKRGAKALVVEDKGIAYDGVTTVRVKDSRAALARMSVEYFGRPAEQLTTVAVTGTKGKTTTVAMIRSILETAGIKTGTIGTLGILIGDRIYKTNNTTPESYEIQQAMRRMVDDGCKAMVIEASSLGLKWHRTDGILFDYGIFTNFSSDHIGDSEHKDMAEYLACKSLLFRCCKAGIINIDDDNAEAVIKGHTCTIESYGYSENAELVAHGDELVAKAGFIGVHFNTTGAKELSVDVAIPGRFSVYNALAAIAVCRHFDIDDDAILRGLSNVKVKGRVEVVPVPGNYTMLIDYAHNAVSMENVLSTLREYKPHRLITMFGAGGNRPKSRRYEMGEVSGRLSDLSVVTEDNSRYEDVMDIIADIKIGLDKVGGNYVVIPNRIDAIRYCIENAEDGDIVVLAGKGHEDYQEIRGVKYHMDEREIIADIIDGNRDDENPN
ncbi:MAG: UDP-N-acetylmuramoyl-L-alanyl-D-glutamate--2,6-diaminopimelate ligase [Ruminococcus sp.]|nr:UDP-N-acetylmuramoyl-L-alanyl-D-glutamate--2,6-diaminopimelate ligase [Ruminococcus sp.]MBQ9515603.1 UDP-N-acetylmuramoyl-L-alanyl-D-glutamate--2,6-diaminopimelate ligase [Ruminococcus sp.]